MRQVHPLTDAHTAGVIHSLREIKATKAPRRLLVWLARTLAARGCLILVILRSLSAGR